MGARARRVCRPSPGASWWSTTTVYESEMAANERNDGLAHLMHSYGRMWFDPDDATDVYTRQCSLLVTAQDLAAMGATLANGGVNPVTGAQVIAAEHCHASWP